MLLLGHISPTRLCVYNSLFWRFTLKYMDIARDLTQWEKDIHPVPYWQACEHPWGFFACAIFFCRYCIHKFYFQSTTLSPPLTFTFFYRNIGAQPGALMFDKMKLDESNSPTREPAIIPHTIPATTGTQVFSFRWCLSQAKSFDHVCRIWIQILKVNKRFKKSPSES